MAEEKFNIETTERDGDEFVDADVPITLNGDQPAGTIDSLRELRATTSVSGTTTTDGEDTIHVDPTGTNGVTITLGSGDTATGQEVTVQDVGGAAASNTITVDTEGSETFADGDAAKTITTDYGWLTVRWDGSNWISDRYAEFDAVRAGSVNTSLADITDSAQDPATNGEIRRNGTDIKAYTGGSVKNLSDIGSGGGGGASKTTARRYGLLGGN